VVVVVFFSFGICILRVIFEENASRIHKIQYNYLPLVVESSSCTEVSEERFAAGFFEPANGAAVGGSPEGSASARDCSTGDGESSSTPVAPGRLEDSPSSVCGGAASTVVERGTGSGATVSLVVCAALVGNTLGSASAPSCGSCPGISWRGWQNLSSSVETSMSDAPVSESTLGVLMLVGEVDGKMLQIKGQTV